jgi:hypothetical protein
VVGEGGLRAYFGGGRKGERGQGFAGEALAPIFTCPSLKEEYNLRAPPEWGAAASRFVMCVIPPPSPP